MRKKWIIILGGVVLIMAIGAVFAFGKRTYTIGKDPKLEEITSVSAGGGGMMYNSSWSWSASYRISKGTCKLYRRMWDEEANAFSEGEVEISLDEYMRILQSIEGLKYAHYDPPKDVMDGYSESARIFWMDSPSGTYRIEFGEGGMRGLLQAFNDVWEENKENAVFE